MKYISIILCFFLLSCSKGVDSLEELTAYIKGDKPIAGKGLSVPVVEQRGRVSIWLMFDSSNYVSARADYAELSLSDTFSNATDSHDEIKIVDGSDNLGIKPWVDPSNPMTMHILSRQERQYPQNQEWICDSIPLRTWNYTMEHFNYWFKIIGNNIPSQMYIAIYDKFRKSYISVPNNNNTQWYFIDVSDEYMRYKDRFVIIVRRLSW